MNTTDTIDRAIRDWIEIEGDRPAPARLAFDVAEATESRRPRPTWVASVLGDRAGWSAPELGRSRRSLALVVVLALTLMVVGAAIIASGAVFPALKPSPTAAQLPGPVLDIPDGLAHRLTVPQVEALALAQIARNVGAAGRVRAPAAVLVVNLIPPELYYEYPNPAGGAGATFHSLTWAVEVTGTMYNCSSFGCSTFGSGMLAFDDATGDGWASFGGTSPEVGPPPAAAALTTYLASVGDTMVSGAVIESPPEAVYAAINAGWVRPEGSPTRGSTGPGWPNILLPVSGVITLFDPTKAGPSPIVGPGAERSVLAFYSVDVPEATGGYAWALVDATTFELIASAGRG